MADSDIDLLAFTNLEEEVDRIFRAYLDMQLLDFRHKHRSELPEYWTEVMKFRRTKFGDQGRADCEEEESDCLDPAQEASRMANDGSSQGPDDYIPFRYWLDVRAHHWSTRPTPDIENVAKTLVPAKRLEWLVNEAQQLQTRIDGFGADLALKTGVDGAAKAGRLKVILSGVTAPASKTKPKAGG